MRATVARPGRERLHIATAVLLSLSVAVVAAVDPHTSGRYPSCPWHAVTGLWCPGCGGLRAVHDLAHGQLGVALHENLLVVLVAPSLAVWWLIARLRRTGGRPGSMVLSTRGALAIVAVLALFTVVRNLSLGATLAP